jgi:hypothetical protein
VRDNIAGAVEGELFHGDGSTGSPSDVAGSGEWIHLDGSGCGENTEHTEQGELHGDEEEDEDADRQEQTGG